MGLCVWVLSACADNAPLSRPDAAATGDSAADVAVIDSGVSGMDSGSTPDAGRVEDAASSDSAPRSDAGAELCNGFDDNADGRIDEGCACAVGATQLCYPGPMIEASRGTCRPGTQRCNGEGEVFGWGECVGAIRPVAEVCGDSMDQDCNGVVDDGAGCCRNGATESCYAGPAGTAGVGACRAGTRTCASGAFGMCAGAVVPTAEACGNSVDDDCDGMVDEGCGVCAPGATRTCYAGPAGTAGVGVCRGGTEQCDASRNWSGSCIGQVVPGAESCGNGVDDDCDGMADEGCATCAPGVVRWAIPAGTVGGPSCITTGGGSCEAMVTCSGSSCGTPSCGAGVPHCGTLRCNDGTYERAQYCSVRAMCTGGGLVTTGFSW